MTSTSLERRNSVLSFATSRKSQLGEKTFVKVLYGDNKTLIINSYCSCLHLINYVKEKLSLTNEDTVDFIDLEGFVKEMPATNKDYAINHLNPTTSYILIKIDTDTNTGEKRYTALLHESKLNTSVAKSLVNLNTGKAIPGKDKSKAARDAASKNKPQSQTTTSQSLKSSTASTRKNSKK